MVTWQTVYRSEKFRRDIDKRRNLYDPCGYNVTGIEFRKFDDSNSHMDSRIVEMVRAPIDSDVTCVLSVLAHGYYCSHPSTATLKPLIGFSKPAEEV